MKVIVDLKTDTIIEVTGETVVVDVDPYEDLTDRMILNKARRSGTPILPMVRLLLRKGAGPGRKPHPNTPQAIADIKSGKYTSQEIADRNQMSRETVRKIQNQLGYTLGVIHHDWVIEHQHKGD